MADITGSPISVKVEENSQSVILTYFQGDIGSMVDQHFSRALSRTDRAKRLPVKAKKSRKSVKSEESKSCQWNAVPSASYLETQYQPIAGRLCAPKEAHSSLSFAPVDESPSLWPPFRQAGGLGLPPISYALPPEGLGLTGQQYTTSLLNLLHSDHSEMGANVASDSKSDLLASWTAPTGFRDPVDPTVGFDAGRTLDKKDLYWY